MLRSDPKDFIIWNGATEEKTFRAAWNLLRQRAGVPDAVPYSLRHGMGRELRKRSVPLEQIKLYLGHKPKGSDITTSVYAPLDPEYCSEAKEAVDSVFMTIEEHCGFSIGDPKAFAEHLKRKHLREGNIAGRRRLSPDDVDRATRLIQDRVAPATIARMLGVSSAAIYKRKKMLQRDTCRMRAEAKASSR